MSRSERRPVEGACGWAAEAQALPPARDAEESRQARRHAARRKAPVSAHASGRAHWFAGTSHPWACRAGALDVSHPTRMCGPM